MKKSRKQLKAEQLAAFNTIVYKYEEPLLRYAARLTNNANAAQDVVQNTFIRLFKKWNGPLEPSANLASWLYRVTHNCAVDYIRKESRRHLLHIQHAAEIDNFIPPNRGTDFRIGNQAEKAAAALRTLSEREQQLVILKIYEEKSYREISEITGLTVTNVGYILHHAMKKMAAKLKRAEDHEQ